jgi:hypothetical protein
LAAPGRYYGDGGTIHHTNEVNIETFDGAVVAVWFRCSMLAFTTREVEAARAKEMIGAYVTDAGALLSGIEIQDS